MTSDDDASSPARAQALFTPTLWANRSGSTTVRKVLHPARARDAAPAHHRSSWSPPSTSCLPLRFHARASVLVACTAAPTCFLASPFACVRRPIVVVHARPHVYYQNSLFASRHMYPYFTVSQPSRLAHRLVCSRLPSPLPLASPPHPTIGSPSPAPTPAPAPQCVVGLEARMHTTYVFIAYLVVLLLHRRCAVFTPYLSLTLSLSLAPILALRISPRPA